MDASKSFFFTKTAIVIPTVTGSLSFLSSFAIVVFVIRSRSNTVYHRILFVMSLFDMMSSLAIALTTLPMPSDVSYPYSGPSYGTVKTCEAQGFAYVIGSAMTLCMNSVLNIYYLCTLRYNMSEKVFSRYIEPALYILPIISSLAVGVSLLLQRDLLNPSVFDSLCVPDTYPFQCDIDRHRVNGNTYTNDVIPEDYECRGDRISLDLFQQVIYFIAVGSLFATLIVTMGLIVLTFYQREKSLQTISNRGNNNGSGSGSDSKVTNSGNGSKVNSGSGNGSQANSGRSSGNGSGTSSRGVQSSAILGTTSMAVQESPAGAGITRSLYHAARTRRMINKQVVMYFAAFWLTWIFSLLVAANDGFGNSYWVQALRLATQPLQGFYNMLIFFYYKVSLLIRNDEDRTVSTALRILFLNPRETHDIRQVLEISVLYEQNLPSTNRSNVDDGSAPHDQNRNNGTGSIAMESVNCNVEDVSFDSESRSGLSSLNGISFQSSQMSGTARSISKVSGTAMAEVSARSGGNSPRDQAASYKYYPRPQNNNDALGGSQLSGAASVSVSQHSDYDSFVEDSIELA